MKYLINNEFEIVMKGNAITKDNVDESEFIYETGGKTKLTTSQLQEIAEANDVKIKGKKVAELQASLDSALSKIKDIPEKKEMTETEKVLKIVDAGFKAKKEEDDILIEIVKSGIGFQKAIKFMKNAMVELGLSVSPKDRYEKAAGIMDEEGFEPENYAEVLEMAEQLAKEINSVSEKQALTEIRKYCKANTIDLPKKVKKKLPPLDLRIIYWVTKNFSKTPEDLEEAFEGEKEKVVSRWMEKFEKIKSLEPKEKAK